MDRPKPTPPKRRPVRALRRVEETSAGGVVVDRSGVAPRVAVIGRISRRGRLEWCLPKGHLEDGETAEDAAVREVAEDRRVHKIVYHYLLEALGGELSVDGDPDAEAVEAAWVPVHQLGALLAYPNERRLVSEVADLFTDIA